MLEGDETALWGGGTMRLPAAVVCLLQEIFAVPCAMWKSYFLLISWIIFISFPLRCWEFWEFFETFFFLSSSFVHVCHASSPVLISSQWEIGDCYSRQFEGNDNTHLLGKWSEMCTRTFSIAQSDCALYDAICNAVVTDCSVIANKRDIQWWKKYSNDLMFVS